MRKAAASAVRAEVVDDHRGLIVPARPHPYSGRIQNHRSSTIGLRVPAFAANPVSPLIRMLVSNILSSSVVQKLVLESLGCCLC